MSFIHKIFGLALLAVLMFRPPALAAEGEGLFLELRSYPEKNILYRAEVEKGFTFSTVIKHSVHLSPVYETYRVEGEDKIVLEATRLKDMGWGVPSTYDNPSKIEKGYLTITALEKSLILVPFRVSHLNEPLLLLGPLPDNPDEFPESGALNLVDYAADGKRVDIRVTGGLNRPVTRAELTPDQGGL